MLSYILAAVVATFLIFIVREAFQRASFANRRNRRYWGRSHGVVLLEMAIALPVFLLLLIGGLDLSRLVGARNDLNYTAEATASCLLHTPSSCPDPQAYAQQVGSGVGLNSSAITATVNAGVTPNTVTVTYTWVPVSPFFHTVTLQATATAP